MNKLQNFFKTFFLLELVKGMALTGRHMFQRKITVQFPDEKTPMSPRFGRSMPFVKRPKGPSKSASSYGHGEAGLRETSSTMK